MRHEFGISLAALAVSLMAGAVPAKADFWSDAGAKYQGVTLHGVTESTPPSNYIKDQMYDKAIKDM